MADILSNESQTSRFISLLKTCNLHCGQMACNLKGISERQYKRWVEEGRPFRITSVLNVALKLWEKIDNPDAQETKKLIYWEIRRLLPDVAVESWAKADFIDFWIALAKEHLDPSKTNQILESLKIDAQIFIAASRKSTWGSFKPLDHVIAPVRAGQALRIKISANRTAYWYVFWITPTGTAEPIYPWSPNDWQNFPTSEEKMVLLELPLNASKTNNAWRFEDTPGLETMVVIAREQLLPKSDRHEIKRLLSEIPQISPGVCMEPGPVRFFFEHSDMGSTRLNYQEVRIKDVIGNRHHTLAARLGSLCDSGLCISFRNDG